MIVSGVMTEVEAFRFVDWNVMAILVGVWIIAGYFGKTGVPSWLSVQALRLSGGRAGLLVMILSTLAGLISMFVDNVVVILMMGRSRCRWPAPSNCRSHRSLLMIGFSANFMGTALLLGDLPPQMLHSVSGAEFMDFIWQQGRPSSFPILMVTFVITLAAMYAYGFRARGRQALDIERLGVETHIPNRLFAGVVVGWFLLTVLAMALRQVLGFKLGFIALTGAVSLVLLMELLGRRVNAPDFEEILGELDWRAILFYMALFALVGALEKAHILDALAAQLKPLFADNLALGASLLFWITVPIVGIVEHDAYILTFLYTIKDLQAAGVDPGRCGGSWCGRARWAAISPWPVRRRCLRHSTSASARRSARSRCASFLPGACRSRSWPAWCAICSPWRSGSCPTRSDLLKEWPDVQAHPGAHRWLGTVAACRDGGDR